MSDIQSRSNAAVRLPGWYSDGRGYERWWDGERWCAPARRTQSTPAPDQGRSPYSSPRSFADVPELIDRLDGVDIEQTVPRSLIRIQFERPTQPSRKKRRAVLLLPVIAAVFTVLGLLGLNMLDLLHRSDSPRDVAEQYLAASETGDCHAIDDLVVDDLSYLADLCRSRADKGIAARNRDYAIGVQRQVSDTAVISVEFAADADSQGADTPARLELVRQDGEWLVDGMKVQGVEVLTPTK